MRGSVAVYGSVGGESFGPRRLVRAHGRSRDAAAAVNRPGVGGYRCWQGSPLGVPDRRGRHHPLVVKGRQRRGCDPRGDRRGPRPRRAGGLGGRRHRVHVGAAAGLVGRAGPAGQLRSRSDSEPDGGGVSRRGQDRRPGRLRHRRDRPPPRRPAQGRGAHRAGQRAGVTGGAPQRPGRRSGAAGEPVARCPDWLLPGPGAGVRLRPQSRRPGPADRVPDPGRDPLARAVPAAGMAEPTQGPHGRAGRRRCTGRGPDSAHQRPGRGRRGKHRG